MLSKIVRVPFQAILCIVGQLTRVKRVQVFECNAFHETPPGTIR